MTGALRYLLDTNILSDLLRHPRGRVAEKIESMGEDQICTSLIVAAELRYGALKSRSVRLKADIAGILASLRVLPFGPAADNEYAEIRDHLTRKGQLIGPNDLLIAAQARSKRLILVTGNLREFRRVPGLATENWLD